MSTCHQHEYIVDCKFYKYYIDYDRFGYVVETYRIYKCRICSDKIISLKNIGYFNFGCSIEAEYIKLKNSGYISYDEYLEKR